MRKKAFFENLGAILTFALIGTVISTFVIALIVYGFAQFITHTVAFKFIDMVYFGAIISATDPVTVLSIFSVIIKVTFIYESFLRQLLRQPLDTISWRQNLNIWIHLLSGEPFSCLHTRYPKQMT